MVVSRRKKVRKMRGHRSYGKGSHKKARGAGNRGGRGKAGYHKHKWSYTVKYEPDHFGKRGFKRFFAPKIKAVNIDDLEKMVSELLEKKIAVKEGGAVKINVMKIGFQKVLGGGKLTVPLIVEAKNFSESAIKKIEAAGGKAVKI